MKEDNSREGRKLFLFSDYAEKGSTRLFLPGEGGDVMERGEGWGEQAKWVAGTPRDCSSVIHRTCCPIHLRNTFAAREASRQARSRLRLHTYIDAKTNREKEAAPANENQFIRMGRRDAWQRDMSR